MEWTVSLIYVTDSGQAYFNIAGASRRPRHPTDFMLPIGSVRNTQNVEVSLRAQRDLGSQALESRKRQLGRKANWGNDEMISL